MYITENDEVPCRRMDPEIWFARTNSHRSDRAKKLCLAICPEQKACLASTMRFELREGITQTGVFGGMKEPERLALRRRIEQESTEAASA